VEDELGPIDVWVNDAFTSVFAKFTDIEPEEYKRVTEVTYLGYVNGTRAALRRMQPRNRGTIVQVGSALAYRGIPLQTAYCGAKHAIQGFNEALRCELLHDKSAVATTMVQLPAVNTPQFDRVRNKLRHKAQPVPPIYQPEVIARDVLYAADHPRRREYWCGETTAATLIANAVAPALLDRYLAKTGYQSQQTPESNSPGDPGNLSDPVDGPDGSDHGAHGRFDAESHAPLAAGLAVAASRADRCRRGLGGRSRAGLAEPHGTTSALRTAASLRAGWGLVLLIRPDVAARLLGSGSAGAHPVLRLLGIRHLVEAGALALRPERETATAACVVDGTHVLSCLLLGAVDPHRRPPAARDAAVETAVLAGTWLTRR
jgi:short-subunit dehydrogenase